MANWIDKVVSWISPRAGAEREAWRQYGEILKKNYDAGSYSRLNHNWRVYNDSAERTDQPYRETVRARARDMERNSDMLNSVVSAFVRNVYGRGYKLRPQTQNPELNDQILKCWRIWTKKQNCDVTGQQSFGQMMRMAVRRKKVDGGILFIKCYTSGGYLPFKLQAIEVDELSETTLQPKNEGNRVVGGIEYDAYNKPVGYWIKQYAIDGLTYLDPRYVPAKDVIFYYTKRRPSQIREMSDMAPTLTRIRDANEYMEAESVKERILACLSVFIKRTLPPAGLGRSAGTIRDENGNEQYAGKTLSPGMIQYLNAGDDVSVVNPSGQSSDATQYIKQQLRLIGSGQGLSYESTSRDMSETNYSSARQGAIEDDLTYQEDIELLMEVFDEVYETFLISLALTGKIEIKNFWRDKDTYMRHEWIKAPKAWIDPQKESNATATALKTGQKTFAQVQAEQGRDWKEVIDEMAEVQEYANAKGVSLNFGGETNGEKNADDGDGAEKSAAGD